MIFSSLLIHTETMMPWRSVQAFLNLTRIGTFSRLFIVNVLIYKLLFTTHEPQASISFDIFAYKHPVYLSKIHYMITLFFYTVLVVYKYSYLSKNTIEIIKLNINI